MEQTKKDKIYSEMSNKLWKIQCSLGYHLEPEEMQKKLATEPVYLDGEIYGTIDDALKAIKDNFADFPSGWLTMKNNSLDNQTKFINRTFGSLEEAFWKIAFNEDWGINKVDQAWYLIFRIKDIIGDLLKSKRIDEVKKRELLFKVKPYKKRIVHSKAQANKFKKELRYYQSKLNSQRGQ